MTILDANGNLVCIWPHEHKYTLVNRHVASSEFVEG